MAAAAAEPQPSLVPATPAENQGDAAKEAVGSPPSTSLGSWDVAAFSAAERKAWPSTTLFELTPLVARARDEGGTDRDALEQWLKSLKRKQLQKLAKTLRVSGSLSNDELVRQLLDAVAAVQQPPAECAPEAKEDTVDGAPTPSAASTATATAATVEGKKAVRGATRRRLLSNGLRIDVESPFGDEPREGSANQHEAEEAELGLAAADEPQCNAQCRVCKLPFYTASGNTDCVDCRPSTAQQQDSALEDTVCMCCGRGDAEELMLLCEGCDNARHTFCCEPQLDSVPEHDWFCGACSDTDDAPVATKPQSLDDRACRVRSNLIQPVGDHLPGFRSAQAPGGGSGAAVGVTATGVDDSVRTCKPKAQAMTRSQRSSSRSRSSSGGSSGGGGTLTKSTVSVGSAAVSGSGGFKPTAPRNVAATRSQRRSQ